jgi:hypothetical protein
MTQLFHVATSAPMSAASSLDSAQLARVEAMHRGFLYQHLQAVGALLIAMDVGTRLITVEHDEDLEVIDDENHVYAQIKTRNRPLQYADIGSVLERFSRLRAMHAKRPTRRTRKRRDDAETRAGKPTFVVVSNVSPGPQLLATYQAADWPPDVQLIWPKADDTRPKGLAPAWPDLGTAFSWCSQHASRIPYSRVLPDTLVWKLAALVQAAATGGQVSVSHTFATKDLSQFFEQIIQDLHALPEAPDPYVPHQNEPALGLGERVRLVTAPSGAGKTAWASAHAAHDSHSFAYFSASGGSSTFASGLAQQLTAHFFPNDSEVISSVLMPGAAVTDWLRALAIKLRERSIEAAIIIDDSQDADPDFVGRAMDAMPAVSWTLLAQPGPTASRLEAHLGIRAETLDGWSPDSIAREMRVGGIAINAETGFRVRDLTGGFPLYVNNLRSLAKRRYGGNVAALCEDLERSSHVETTVQELLLIDVLQNLNSDSKAILAIMGTARVPLSPKEIEVLGSIVGLKASATARCLRELTIWGVARPVAYGQVSLHDAYRVVHASEPALLDADTTAAVLRALRDIFDPAAQHSSPLRMARYLELLPITGGLDRLISIATNESEQLFEVGLAPQVTRVLEQVVNTPSAAAKDRYWASDTLAFWCLHRGDISGAKRSISVMDSILKINALGSRADQAHAIKRLLLAGAEGNLTLAYEAFHEVEVSAKDDSQLLRIARYNLAVVLPRFGLFTEAIAIAEHLISEYFDLLAIRPEDIFAKNIPDIEAEFPHLIERSEDIKHLADVLDLFASAKQQLGEQYGLARIHAQKFFAMSGSYKSSVRVGQDLADDLLKMNDLAGAREFLERTLLPMVTQLRMVDYIIPVRAQMAVILAYSGEVDRARQEIRQLRAFTADERPDRRAELENQERIIEAVAASASKASHERSTKSLRPNRMLPERLDGARDRRGTRKVPRNAACPCGSKKKFKNCCGNRP